MDSHLKFANLGLVICTRMECMNCKRKCIGAMKVWLVATFSFLTCCALSAQEQAIFRHLNKKDGLSQGSVFSIAQDGSGYMWFGTRDGLNKYDGYRFKVYRNNPAKSSSLVDNDVRILYQDAGAKTLWIGTLNGLSRYDKAQDAFVNYVTDNGLSANSIRSIFKDSKQRLWVGTANGLNLYHADNDSFTKVDLQNVPAQSTEISAIFEDSAGKIWIGTDMGLSELRASGAGNFELRKVLFPGNRALPLSDYQIKAIVEDKEANLWIGTQSGGVHYWNRQQNTITTYQHDNDDDNSLSHNNIRSMTLAPDGTLWVGTFVGLNKFLPEKNGFQRFLNEELNPASLSNSSIRAVFFDERGGLWVGTYHGGVNYFDPGLSRFKNFEHLPNRNSLSNNVVSSFVEDEHGNFWIGTEGGGLNYFDRKTGTFIAYQLTPESTNSIGGNNVKTILKDGQQLWVGTFTQGLDLFDIATKQFRHFKHKSGTANSLSDNNVYSLYKEGNRLWIVTYGGGINLLDLTSGNFHHYKNDPKHKSSLSSNLGRVIIKDSRQRLWIGTEKGLNLVRRDSMRDLNLVFQHFLPEVQVYAIFEDKSGILWIGTFSDGLFAFNPNDFSYRQYTEADGLPGHTIFGVLQDNAGQLWLSTNNGITKFDSRKNIFTNYNYSNGLKNLEFNFNAHYKARSGELLFGGTNGFTIFQPTEIVPNKYVPPVVFTDLKAFNETVEVDTKSNLLPQVLNQTKSLTFRYNEAIFSIGFAALDYFNPSNNQYAFMLEGLENTWNHAIGQTEATYTIQRPGTYTFRLKGANSDGVWNPEERRLQITVLPPPWRSGWAYLIYTVLLAGALYGIWHFVRLRHRLQLEQLAKQQQEELNEMKLRFFTNITHEFRTPLTLILGPLEEMLQKYNSNGVHKQLLSIQRNAQRLLNLVNQVLTFRKLETDHEQMQATEGNIVAFLRDIFISFEESARLRGMAYRFRCPDDEIMVWFDHDKLEKVFFNLLSNAFKFTPDGGSVSLEILQQKTQVEISVCDNGNGIKPELHEQIFKRFYEKINVSHSTIKGTGIGLALSRQMIELHHGDIRVESEVGQGAKFIVALPLGRKHLKDEEVAEKEIVAPNPVLEKALKTAKVPDFQWLDEPETELPTDAPVLLIVEDNEEVREYIQRIFQHSYRMILAVNGKEGLAFAKQHKPDLIISDVMMPEMDGTTMCGKLKTNIKTSHIPIILLTARTAQVFRLEGLETGADDYVTKPFNPEELRLRVRNLIQARQTLREKFVRVMNFEPKEITVTSADEDFLKRSMEIVEKHIENPSFTVEQFAYELAVSRPLLFTKLKALTDQTPNNFMKTIRLKRAAQLLEQRKLNVSEVAYKVGFRDTRYFSKCFQKQFQKTPTEYMSEQ